MAKAFSVASWNVEHFKDDPSRVGRVVEFMNSQSPDVFGLYEVEGATIFAELVQRMPGYTFQITEGLETQEILIGVRKGLTAFITQKTEFRSGTTHMRPGQLVTVNKNGLNYSLLFLHLASGPDPRGMGLRDDMLQRALDFRRELDKAYGGPGQARYLFLGDLNTMGFDYPFGRAFDAGVELQKWDREARKSRYAMRRLSKTHDASWSNGSRSGLAPANLDHVFASSNLAFRSFRRPLDGLEAQVALRGWVEAATPAAADAWIRDYSDHSLMYFEVQA
ncbi:endonuclease/exonuclease/phosphatase family protein [Roseateles violae]|uniref:Endonuclease/exonuclease/phosphatase family protein n=1 Tax=Roseateles violae TaxID=3058042 RepID=A0ABT8DM58_9BURK|nr:endonuclease/exonuclease/phosphatase family protein [Pelomonas sp. PFR6]MDN3919192.1 endonuclease/exonuclease/phosphatase family protein [Pelomonas sp. PFR6]